MTAPAAPPAAFPLPADPAAALDAGRAVLFRHPRTGASFRLAPEPDPAAGTAKGDAERDLAPGELTYEQYAAAQLAADGGEKLTELEALRRAVASNQADRAAGIEPMTHEEANAWMEEEFPALKAHRERQRRERAGTERRT